MTSSTNTWGTLFPCLFIYITKSWGNAIIALSIFIEIYRKKKRMKPHISPNIWFHSLSTDMFIITDYKTNFNTIKPKNNHEALIIFRKLYSLLLNSISFSSIECECGSHDWYMHSSYKRYHDFLGRKIRVTVQRIICAHCGKTHVLLIDDMIPYSTISFQTIISSLDDESLSSLDTSHLKYLHHKFYNIPSLYFSFCIFSCRNWPILFIST